MGRSPHIQRRNPSHPWRFLGRKIDPVDRNEDGAPENREDEKDVAAHPGEANEEGGIHAYEVDHIQL